MNALNVSLVDALMAALNDAYEDGTRVLILLGNGKNFSAGLIYQILKAHQRAICVAVRAV